MPDNEGTDHSLRFAIDLQVDYVRTYMHVVLAGVAWLTMGYGAAVTLGSPSLALLMILLGYTLWAWFVFLRSFWLRRQVRALSVRDGVLWLPTLYRWSGLHAVTLADVVSLQWADQPRPGMAVLIQRGRWPTTVPARWFTSVDEAKRFLDVLQMRTRAPVSVIENRRWIQPLVWLLIGVVLVSHLGRVLLDEDTVIAWLRWGALNAVLVQEGEWYRLLTHAFVHGNAFHLLANMALILLLMPDLQRRLGSAGVMLVFVGATLTAAFACVMFSDAVTVVGASGGAYGLIGAVLVLWWLDRQRVPWLLRSSPGWFLGALLVVDLLHGVLNPVVAVSMHIGGLLAGAAIAWLLLRGQAWSWTIALWGGWLSMALLLLALVQNVSSLLIDRGLSSAQRLVGSAFAPMEEVNLGAWWLATEPAVKDDALRRAATAMQARAGSVPLAPEYVDTLATLFYRLGDYEMAVSLQVTAVDRLEDPALITQLARFEVKAADRIWATPVIMHAEGAELCLRWDGDTMLDVDVLVYQAAALVGMLRVEAAERGNCVSLPAALVGRANQRQEFRLGRAAVHPGESGRLRSRYWPMVADILALP